jgi:hypothetical protein
MAKIDIASETWAVIKQACTEFIANEQQALGGLDCTEKRADQARGAIHACTQILRLAEPPPATPEPIKRSDRSGY